MTRLFVYEEALMLNDEMALLIVLLPPLVAWWRFDRHVG